MHFHVSKLKNKLNFAILLRLSIKAVADDLGMGTKSLENMSIGFAYESTFQTYGNSARLWSFHKGLIRKENTNRTKQNCFGFYAIRGKSLLIPIKKGNEQTFLAMLDKIKEQHLHYYGIILIWDNYKAHTTPPIEQKAYLLGINIVNLPTYSPNRFATRPNPIERLWKSIKTILAEVGFIEHLQHLNQPIDNAFKKASDSLSFAKKWIEDFWNVIFWKSPIQLCE
jgi:transposase